MFIYIHVSEFESTIVYVSCSNKLEHTHTVDCMIVYSHIYIYISIYRSIYIYISISIYLSIYLWASPKNLTYPKWTFPKHYCLFWFFKFWFFSRYVLYEEIGNCWRFSKQITFFQCETWSVKSCEHFAQLYVGAMWPNTLHRMSYCRISTHMKLCD